MLQFVYIKETVCNKYCHLVVKVICQNSFLCLRVTAVEKKSNQRFIHAHRNLLNILKVKALDFFNIQ